MRPFQKRHIESLESQLDVTKNEKAELSRRLIATKDAAKKAIETSAKRFILFIIIIPLNS